MTKLKVGITGHTQGIGAAFADYFKDEEVHGFSRSNGWNLFNKASCDALIHNMKNFNIFINNAPVGEMQEYLFTGILEKWVGEDKTIVNISSIAGDISPAMMNQWLPNMKPEGRDKVGEGIADDELSNYLQAYVKSKRRLDKISSAKTLETCITHDNKPHIINLKPAATSTELLGDHVFLNYLLDVEDFMSVFDMAYKMRDKVKFSNLTFIGTKLHPNAK